MKPLISIILPVYNAQQYLAEAIESVIASTFKQFELLCINDGSSDNSVAIIKDFITNDSRIKLIQLEHKGIVSALNAGLHSSQADIVARMDGDDVCHPERFELQYNELIANTDISLTSCLVEPFSATTLTEGTRRYFQWLNRSISHSDIVRDLYIESPIIHPSVMFRKSSVKQIGCYREYDGPEDYDLWLRMAEEDMTFSKINKVLLRYRIHDMNFSQTDMVHYHKDAFLKRKLQFVANSLSTGKIGEGKIVRICGFAKEGKKLFNHLQESNTAVDAFVDIAPQKVTRRYKNTPVLSPGTVGVNDKTIFYLCLIKKWGALEELRNFFFSKNKVEGKDYLLL